jgi:putative NIF3 family GTP cyclohydrolase 1 type 2
MGLALEMAGLDEIPPDSGIHVPGKNVKRVLLGIDMETPELLLAKQLNFDLVIGHHPAAGLPAVYWWQVMDRQIELMVKAGVPINRAQRALKRRREMVEKRSHVGNYDRSLSAAKLLNLPYMNIHQPIDIITEQRVDGHLQQRLSQNPRAKLEDVVNWLLELPEYKKAATKPKIRVGDRNDYAGKVVVSMAGGTNGGGDVAKAYFEAGVGCLVLMHMEDSDLKEVREHNMGSIIVAGHMASDSIGLNIFAEKLREKGLEVVTTAGIIEK